MNITTASLFPGLDGFAKWLGFQFEVMVDESRRDTIAMLSQLPRQEA